MSPHSRQEGQVPDPPRGVAAVTHSWASRNPGSWGPDGCSGPLRVSLSSRQLTGGPGTSPELGEDCSLRAPLHSHGRTDAPLRLLDESQSSGPPPLLPFLGLSVLP